MGASRVARALLALGLAFACAAPAAAQVGLQVVDLATREGVKQRFVYLNLEKPKAVLVLFAGGHGGLRIAPDGALGGGQNNFLVRTRELFVNEGLAVVLLDAPSDRQGEPYLDGMRQSAEHLADVRAVIAWLRGQVDAPVWLAGASRGTLSVGHVATELERESGGPDGVVLAAPIMRDANARALPRMPLEKIKVPVLLVHHRDDACPATPYEGVPALLDRLTHSPRRALITAEGGRNDGDPCQGFAYHGFNGLEADTVAAIAKWMLAP